MMWAMIKVRVIMEEDAPTLALRPGFKIVKGFDMDDVMDGLFSGLGKMVRIHVGSAK